MKELLLVFLGGGTGSVLRYLLSQMRLPLAQVFPLPTLCINVLGSFLIGLFSAWALRSMLTNDLRLLLVVGFCGGFTTFSTFSNEGLQLLRSGDVMMYAIYVLLSVLGGICACWMGWKIVL